MSQLFSITEPFWHAPLCPLCLGAAFHRTEIFVLYKLLLAFNFCIISCYFSQALSANPLGTKLDCLESKCSSYTKLGQGGFGRVYSANIQGHSFAVKIQRLPVSTVFMLYDHDSSVLEWDTWSGLYHLFLYVVWPSWSINMPSWETMETFQPQTPKCAAWDGLRV